jgi:hypothetical protein
MVNVGSFDRVIRFAIGAALAVAPFVLPEVFAPLGPWRFAVAAVGAVLFGTAVLRICPAYILFGIRTCSIERT